jgi:Lipase (class 3)
MVRANLLLIAPRKLMYYPARNARFFESGLPKTEAALCAEMSRLAYCRKEPHFSFDREQISQVLGRLGFGCRFFEKPGTPQGMGTHCILAFHDDPEPTRNLCIVAFRGTDANDPSDIATDAEFLQTESQPGGRVHKGFAEALEDVLSALSTALAEFSIRILYTGHSLGAALATLLSSIRRPDFLYAFGSPRVGNGDFVATLNGLSIRRFVNCCDIVPRMPPPKFGKVVYAHYGAAYYIRRNGKITEDPPDNCVREDRIVAASEYLAKYAWRVGNLAVRELADHSPINYLNAVAANTSSPKLAGL